MKCEKCGNVHYKKICPYCDHEVIKNNQNKKANIPLIIIAICVSLITIIMITREYKEYKQNQQVAKMIFGTDDPNEIEKTNNKLMKDIQKLNKQLNNF